MPFSWSTSPLTIFLLPILTGRNLIADSTDVLQPEVQAGQLTAGDTDDNLNFNLYLKYKERTVKESQWLPSPDLSDRLPVLVTDTSGTPFSCPELEITSATGNTTILPAGTNGRAFLFPSFEGYGPTLQVRAKPPGGTCPTDCSQSITASVNSTGSVPTAVLQISSASSSLPKMLDLALIVDTTSSMCDELVYLQAELAHVIEQVTAESDSTTLDVKVAYVVYRDTGDEYVTETKDFSDTSTTVALLSAELCAGGGDYPEAMDAALVQANTLSWRSGNVARVAIIVADAPPRNELIQDTLDQAMQLRSKGVRLYSLAASGVALEAQYIMRLMALLTGAWYLFLTDDSGIGNPHMEPDVACYKVTQLDQLLIRLLDSELSGTRIEASDSSVIREIGQQENGICLVNLNPPETDETKEKEDGSTITSSDSVGDRGGGEFSSDPSGGGLPTDSSVSAASVGRLAAPSVLIMVAVAAFVACV